MQHPKKVQPKRKISTKAKLILLGTALILAAAFVLLLPVIRSRFPSRNTPSVPQGSTVRTLYEGDTDQLESLTISQLDGESYTLYMQDGSLHLERDGELLALNEIYADDLLDVATQIVAQDTVTEDESEVAQHLAEMGLDPPQATAVARYRDGTEITFEIGVNVPNTTYAYYRWSGDTGIYMCDSGITDALFLTQNLLLPVSQPSIIQTLIDRVTLKTADDEISMTFLSDDSGYTSGVMETPYVYPMDAEQTSAMLTALSNFRLGTIEAAVTDENRAEYGFDAPLCVVELHQASGFYTSVDEVGALVMESVPESDLRFTIGRAEGDYFYTCEYEGDAYLISRFLVETIVNATPAKLAARQPANLDGALLTSIVIQTPETLLEVSVSRTERVLSDNSLEVDSDGNIVYDTAIAFNGADASQERLDTLVSRLNAMTVSGDLPDDWELPEGETPRWRIELTTEGGTTRVIEAYRLDAFSDALVVDGEARHYAYVEVIEVILADLV